MPTFLEEIVTDPQIVPLIHEILDHPFTMGIDSGSLHQKVFLTFLEQDSYYLPVFINALKAAEALCVSGEKAAQFKKYAEDSLLADEMVKKLYEAELRKSLCLQIVNPSAFFSKWKSQQPKNAACRDYCAHLKSTAKSGHLATLVASLLPCFWLYRLLGQRINPQSLPAEHPYRSWICSYADEGFYQAVDKMIDVFESLVTDKDKSVMREAFIRSLHCEKAFFDGAFHSEPKNMPEQRSISAGL